MADWQKAERAGIRHLVSQEVANNAPNPQHTVAPGISREAANWLVKMLAGGLEDSQAMMIVSPGGPFYIQPGISAPGGTDAARP